MSDLGEKVLAENIVVANERSLGCIGSTHFSKAQWAAIQSNVRRKGPLSDVEGILYMQETSALQREHYLGLVFEVEGLYEAVKVLAAERDSLRRQLDEAREQADWRASRFRELAANPIVAHAISASTVAAEFETMADVIRALSPPQSDKGEK